MKSIQSSTTMSEDISPYGPNLTNIIQVEVKIQPFTDGILALCEKPYAIPGTFWFHWDIWKICSLKKHHR